MGLLDEKPKIEERTSELLKGYTLTTPSYLAHAEVEEEMHRRFAARYLDIMHRAFPDRDLNALTLDAMDRAWVDKPFAALSEPYLQAVLTDSTLTPYLLVACLSRKHRDVTVQQVYDRLDSEQLLAIRPLLLELFGFVRREPPPAIGDAIAIENTDAVPAEAERGR